MTQATTTDAIAQAIEAGVLRQCPRHPEILVQTGADDRTDLPPGVAEIVEAAPIVCPLCGDEDD